jgi:hypothetical protein
MEVIRSRYGLDRSIEKLNNSKFRIMGESNYVRVSSNKNDETNMFDFEGGPCLTLGSKLVYGGIQWKILQIDAEAPMYSNLYGCVITAEPIY